MLEVAFAMAAFSLFAVGTIYALTLANQFASNSRYETLALAAAQQKIDQIMTASWSASTLASATPTMPPELTSSTESATSTPVVILPLNNDPFNGASGLSSAFTSYDTQVIDSRTTTITKLTDISGKTGVHSRLLRADVTVTYTYRGRTHSVALSTVRTTDDF